MHTHWTPEYGLWLEPLVVLGIGTGVIVALAALADRLVRPAVWRRTVWQVATLTLLALLLVELTGMGAALVGLTRAAVPPTRTSGEAVDVSTAEQDSAAQRDECADEAEHAPRAAALVETDRTTPAASNAIESRGVDGADASPRAYPGGKPAERNPILHAKLGAASGRADLRTSHRPLQLLPTPERDASSRQARAALEGQALQNAGQAFPSTPGAAADVPSGGAWWPGMVWLLGATGIAIRTAWSRWLLVRFRRRHTVASEERLCRRVSTLARRLGIGRRIAVLEAAGLATPVAFGRVRPTLVLPAAFCDEFDPHEQEAMLAHELAHLAARDPAWQLVADLTCALLWWHPLCWWSRRRLRQANEAVADEASLLVPGGPDVLAACLVALGRRLTGMPPRRLGWLSVEGPRFRSNLGRRVDRLLSFPRRSWRPPGGGPLAFARTTLPVLFVIVAVLCTAWVRPQATLAKGGTTMNVLEISWRRSLAAAALVALLGPLSGDAVSQEQEGERDRPVVVRKDSPDQERESAKPGGASARNVRLAAGAGHAKSSVVIGPKRGTGHGPDRRRSARPWPDRLTS